MKQDIDALKLFINSMTGTPKFTFSGRRHGRRPEDEFASVTLITEAAVGIPQSHSVIYQGNERQLTRNLARLRLRVVVVKTEGGAASRITHGWTSEAMKDLMYSTGYGFIGCTPLNAEDTKMDHVEWEHRQGFSIDVYVERNFLEPVLDDLEGIRIEGEYYTYALDAALETVIEAGKLLEEEEV